MVFSAIFLQGRSLSWLLFAYLHANTLSKNASTLKEKTDLSRANSFCLEETFLQIGGKKQYNKIASPKKVLIPLKLRM